MSLLNLYYKAFRAYREHTRDDKNCIKQRDLVMRSNCDQDRLETIRNICHIDEEWVKQIEEGLPYVEKAIAEERQFIKNEGEVVIIEKVKHVSRESLEHLAKHSELITRKPKEETDTLTPDKLYMVERLSDYAVYENKFLYMLLIYLRDFLDLRLKKILEYGNMYKAELTVRKKVISRYGAITLNTDFKEETKRDPYSIFNKEELSVIDRIESCQHVVIALLNKPLMQIVSQVAMIKPPITKTNVLKMNIKFRKAVELYEYISQYEGDGFTIEERRKREAPFSDGLLEEIAEMISLTSFFAYSHGNDLVAKLEEDYLKEKKDEEEKKKKELLAKIESIRESADKKGITLEEYVLMLEESLDRIQEDVKECEALKKSLREASDRNEELKEERNQLRLSVAQLSSDVADRNRIIEEYDKKKEEEITDIERAHKNQIEESEEQHKKAILDLERESEELRAEDKEKIQDLEQRFGELLKERDFISAQLKGLRLEHGLEVEDAYATKESFDELEREYDAFFKYFKKQWGLAKKQIRASLLWNKKPKKQDEDQKLDQKVELKADQKIEPIASKKVESTIEQIESEIKPEAESTGEGEDA